MVKSKMYKCMICGTEPTQLSHHKMHLDTEKHRIKKELFEMKLSKMSIEELKDQYNITNIIEIVAENETLPTYENLNKKLKTNSKDNEDDNNDKYNLMSEEQRYIIDKNSNVTNREALKYTIHEIHNYLRNNGAGYGMNALKVFNIVRGLEQVERTKKLKEVGLTKECRFSHLLKMAEENEDENIATTILKEGGIIDAINDSKLSRLLFYDIPRNIKGSTFAHLIKEVNKIKNIEKTCNVLLSGKIYEYFIGRDESAISELGAYFTDRHIVDYIYSKIDLTIGENGEIDTMIDMFGGSGGFTTGYVDNMIKKYGDKINWNNELKKVYHYDMNEDVIKTAGLELFCLTGVIPDMETNLKYKNSFRDEFEGMKFKKIITNPPYGGDKKNKSDIQNKRDKIKKYIENELKDIDDEKMIKIRRRQLKKIEEIEKQEKKDIEMNKVTLKSCSARIQRYAYNNKLDGKDKESTSLILMMDMLEENGTAVGVLKEGVFFDKKYKKLRKCLIENFNVREIISIPQDQFENTSTKTSIVIFDNTEKKTENIKFSNLVVERYDEDKFGEINNEIVLIENKGDIRCVKDITNVTVSVGDISDDNDIILDGKHYNGIKIIAGDGYNLVKLGKICSFSTKSKRKASFGDTEGKYNFYTSSDKVQKCDIADYKGKSLLIGTGGNSCLHLTSNKFSCSGDTLILTHENIEYIYYIVSILWQTIKNNMKGSTIKHISKKMVERFEIPVPESIDHINKWIEKISKLDRDDAKYKQLLDKLAAESIKNIDDVRKCIDVSVKKRNNII